jgi:hypothetical protein
VLERDTFHSLREGENESQLAGQSVESGQRDGTGFLTEASDFVSTSAEVLSEDKEAREVPTGSQMTLHNDATGT